MKKREQKLVNGYNNNGFDFKGVHYKPLSLRTLSILEQVRSAYISEFGGELFSLLEFLYISSTKSNEIFRVIKAGEWEDTIYEFGEGFNPKDLEEISKLIAEQSDDAGAAIVEIRGDTNEKK